MGESKLVDVRKVKLGPLKCYFEAKEFLGDQYWLFFGIYFVSFLVAGFVPIILLGPAMAGLSVCFLARANKQRVEFEYVYKGFDYFGPSVIATLIYFAALLVLYIPFFVGMIGGVVLISSQEPPLVISGILIIVLAFAYLMLVASIAMMHLMFAILLIVDKKMDAWPATVLALKGISRNLMEVIGVTAVGQLIVTGGMMLCLVPAFLAIPIVITGHFIAYWKIYGVEASSIVDPKPAGVAQGRQKY